MELCFGMKATYAYSPHLHTWSFPPIPAPLRADEWLNAHCVFPSLPGRPPQPAPRPWMLRVGPPPPRGAALLVTVGVLAGGALGFYVEHAVAEHYRASHEVSRLSRLERAREMATVTYLPPAAEGTSGAPPPPKKGDDARRRPSAG